MCSHGEKRSVLMFQWCDQINFLIGKPLKIIIFEAFICIIKWIMKNCEKYVRIYRRNRQCVKILQAAHNGAFNLAFTLLQVLKTLVLKAQMNTMNKTMPKHITNLLFKYFLSMLQISTLLFELLQGAKLRNYSAGPV